MTDNTSEKLKEFGKTKEFKKVKMVMIGSLVLIVLLTFLVEYFWPKHDDYLLYIIPAIVLLAMFYYKAKLRQFSPETSQYADKLDQVRVSGLKRGNIIGLVIGFLFLLFIVIYFFSR